MGQQIRHCNGGLPPPDHFRHPNLKPAASPPAQDTYYIEIKKVMPQKPGQGIDKPVTYPRPISEIGCNNLFIESHLIRNLTEAWKRDINNRKHHESTGALQIDLQINHSR